MQPLCGHIIHVVSLQNCTDCYKLMQLGWSNFMATSMSLGMETSDHCLWNCVICSEQILAIFNSLPAPTYFCRCVPESSQPTCLEAGSSNPLIYCRNFLYAADSERSLLQDWKCSSAVAHGTYSCSRMRYRERFRGTDAFSTPALIKQNKDII